MTYRGWVKNGQILLDAPVTLPEGVEVRVAVLENGATEAGDDDVSSLLLRHAGKGRNLPIDLAAEHDHYAHGKPKR
jgi:hypothetical protein